MKQKTRDSKDDSRATAGAPMPGLLAPVDSLPTSSNKRKLTGPAAASATADPIGDLRAAEAIIDLVRLGIESDFLAGAIEAKQDSGAVAAGHALYLVRRARLSVAEALANQCIRASM
jgi:hypothetical protein